MLPRTKNWMADPTPAAWDPYEVWRQRILLPRLSEQNESAGASQVTGDSGPVVTENAGSESIER